MKKDAYYFPHFCNARHDRKLRRVQKELGIEGYGIYFMLLEVLREQDGFKYPMDDIDLLSDEFGTSEQKINTVICNYKLFTVDEDKNFLSLKMIEYLTPYLERSKRARYAAKVRWENKCNANALPEQSDSNASKVKKSKEKKRKEISDFLESQFESFWNLYAKKVDREKCFKKFTKLSDKELNLIFEKLPLYIAATQNKQYRKNPLTWLNGKCWEDEISIQNQKPSVNYADEIIKAIQINGSYSTPKFDDPKLTHIVSVLGWGNLCKMSTRDIQYRLKSFV